MILRSCQWIIKMNSSWYRICRNMHAIFPLSIQSREGIQLLTLCSLIPLLRLKDFVTWLWQYPSAWLEPRLNPLQQLQEVNSLQLQLFSGTTQSLSPYFSIVCMGYLFAHESSTKYICVLSSLSCLRLSLISLVETVLFAMQSSDLPTEREERGHNYVRPGGKQRVFRGLHKENMNMRRQRERLDDPRSKNSTSRAKPPAT